MFIHEGKGNEKEMKRKERKE